MMKQFSILVWGFVLLFQEFNVIITDQVSETLNNSARVDRINLLQRHFQLRNKKDGTIRLVGGRSQNEGNIEILHKGKYGSICDDEWSKNEATVVCVQLGFLGGKPTHSGTFGRAKKLFWMDNVRCRGDEKSIVACSFDGWGQHDCEPSEVAGVICQENVTVIEQPKPAPKVFKKVKFDVEVKLTGGRTPTEGRLEVKLNNGTWGSVCGVGFTLLEANVVCKQLNLGFASDVFQSDYFGSSKIILSGTKCTGTEKMLSNCIHHDEKDTHCETVKNYVAAVSCRKNVADIKIDLIELEQTAHLEDRPMYFLQCAMEENCVSKQAYEIQRENVDWHMATRRLLKFTAKAVNIGNEDFRPHIPKERWQWHACHMHYHSMEVFAQFDVIGKNQEKVAVGHKASFCLEDNECLDPGNAKYVCANYGDQGISVNCSDIYKFNIDCQWIDITEIDFGQYIFKVSLNPEFKVPEQSFENNIAICDLIYTETHARVFNCKLQSQNL